jgi:type IV pilus assembly protein PilA
MNHKSRTSQGGFSLVELMVVVAIIGVLASIAVPAVNKYIAKARQSEAKTNLSSLYTSEKAFYAEYTTYDSRFAAIGYSPEGQLRYNIGFGAAGMTATGANGFNTPAASISASFTTVSYCGTGGSITNGCTILNGANGAANTIAILAANITTATNFTAGAAAIIHASGPATGDVWSMSDTKVLTNTGNGIP